MKRTKGRKFLCRRCGRLIGEHGYSNTGAISKHKCPHGERCGIGVYDDSACKVCRAAVPDEALTVPFWQKEAHNVAASKGFYEEPLNFGEQLTLIHGELSEAMTEYRNHRTFTEIYIKKGKPEGIPIELADAVLRTMQLAQHLGIDLQTAMIMKNNYNKTRPHRHGGKKV